MLTATLAVVIGLSGGVAVADGGSSSRRPRRRPWCATDQVVVVRSKLDDLYLTQKGCTLRLAVNKPKD